MARSLKQRYDFVVVGGGIAGVSCVDSLRVWSPSTSVLLISASPCIKAVTNAVHITKTLVEFGVQEVDATDIEARHDNVDVVIDEVVSVDTTRRDLRTAEGRIFRYGELCLCVGGKPKLIDESYVLGIRDTDSVTKLREQLKDAKRMIIVGNGGIASELVHEVSDIEKIWVVKDQHINSAFVDPGAAQFLYDSLVKPGDGQEDTTFVKRWRYTADGRSQAALGPDWHTEFDLRGADKNGTLKIEYGATIESIEKSDGDFALKVVLSSGAEYLADVVVSATGVVPLGSAIEITPTPLEIAQDGGIAVDEFLSTSAPHVLAAGDVATACWAPAPHWHQMRLWTQARQMGQYAGRVMASRVEGEAIYPDFCFELFSHVTRFFGFKVILLGLFNGQRLDGQCDILLRVTKGKEFVKLVLKDGKIQGALLIGETDLEEMCENLILDQLDVSQYGADLLDPDIDIDDYFD